MIGFAPPMGVTWGHEVASVHRERDFPHHPVMDRTSPVGSGGRGQEQSEEMRPCGGSDGAWTSHASPRAPPGDAPGCLGTGHF